MQAVDITLIGSGVACTATLTSLLEQILRRPDTSRQLNIIVIEKYGEFWKGIPYGSRSSVNALSITSIKDFFTNDDESSRFFEWLKENLESVLNHYRRIGGATAEQWLAENSPAIEQEDWNNIYLPRFIIGEYIQQKLLKLLAAAEERQLIRLELIHGEATEVKLTEGRYEVVVELANKALYSIKAEKVVVAIGSAPERELVATQNLVKSQCLYINNLYQPKIDDNIALMKTALIGEADEYKRNILVVGSNASCIELLYLFNNDPGLKSLINKIILLSPSGALPHHISYVDHDEPCHHLEQIRTAGNYTLEQLVIAAEKDIMALSATDISIPYVGRVMGLTISLLQQLDILDRKSFYGIYGMRLARLFRRSGRDYKSAADKLLSNGQLELLTGSFQAINMDCEGGLLTYKDALANTASQHPLPFRVVINCTGSNHLISSSCRLIKSLINHNNCRVNLSGKAFEVNEKFEAAPNLYVIGPLIGGTVNKLIHFWHLENASRIMYLAPYLAQELLSS